MSDNVYAISKVVGTSKKSIEDAIENAIARMSGSIKNLDWFEVISTRGYLDEGAIRYYQVTLEVGFRHEA
ncbi:MAG: dodecin domain-containing protein [Marinicaulis sp.]|nr:dodecin family protein [Marinicaulis sp.]NNE41652.1 dodecin domain-containing protein [Marinicaulis sp.]NNL90059.1 dodecin domain-containing protein [Marinicaulis sp.]